MPDGSAIFPLSTRLPPSNVQAEQALLGALLANNKTLDRVAPFLRSEHFADPIHGRIFAEIGRMVQAGRLASAVTLKAALGDAGVLEEVGGVSYLAQLITANIGGTVAAREYGQAIFDAAQARELIDIGAEFVNGLYGGASPAELASRIVAAIDQATRANQIGHAVTLDAAMDDALAAMERARSGETSGISTGFRCLNDRLGGLEPGQVYVLAGRPGMGKSALGHRIAVNAARAGVGVLELSLEMSARQLGQRTLSVASGVPLMAIKRGTISNDDGQRLVVARRELHGLPLTIDDAGGQTPAMIGAKAREAKRRHGLGLLMIDHLNLMRAEAEDAKHGGTWAVGRASNAVLQIAKDCACPVLLLAQLNRGVEGRDDKRPMLADLRQAGDVEQDAYAVGFVYRPEYYLSSEPERKESENDDRFAARRQDWHDRRAAAAGVAEVIWGKVRDGEAGTDRLRFEASTAAFSENVPP